jgi:hypothetical protein
VVGNPEVKRSLSRKPHPSGDNKKVISTGVIDSIEAIELRLTPLRKELAAHPSINEFVRSVMSAFSWSRMSSLYGTL